MSAATAASQNSATAAETDPQTLRWMQGFPPPPDKTITFKNGSFRSFPELRWAWSNIRQLVPTVNVWRGAGPAIGRTLVTRVNLNGGGDNDCYQHPAHQTVSIL
jgi:hypothetical protein